jgi:alpha-beta hydrolase superfamily lysophospholipase
VRPSDNIDMLRGLGRDPLVIKETRFDSIHGLVTVMDDALEAAPRLPLPALVLYGKTEDLVPRRGREVLLDTLPGDGDWRLAEYADGYHMLLRDLNADVVLTDIATWSADPTAPLTSGFERPDRKLAPPTAAE